METEGLDLKEEAGRRDRVGALLPAEATNSAAVNALAGEVRCFANTPGGGAIILGVDDKTYNLLGTALDVEWLRQRIDDLTVVAPAIEEARALRRAGGGRGIRKTPTSLGLDERVERLYV